MKIKAKFFKIKNVDGELYATVDIIVPKTVDFNDCKIDTNRISERSKTNLIHVGQEQIRKDSLYVSANQERTWINGHLGYFELDGQDIYACLTTEEIIKHHLENVKFYPAWPVDKYLDETHIFRVVPVTKDVSLICAATNAEIMKIYKLRNLYGHDIHNYSTAHEQQLSESIQEFEICEVHGKATERDKKFVDYDELLETYNKYNDYSKTVMTKRLEEINRTLLGMKESIPSAEFLTEAVPEDIKTAISNLEHEKEEIKTELNANYRGYSPEL